MARSISVKIAVADVIADLETALAKIENALVTYPADVEAYNKADAEYNQLVIDKAVEAVEALGEARLPDLDGADHLRHPAGLHHRRVEHRHRARADRGRDWAPEAEEPFRCS